jgi:hypothetical protein
MIRTPETQRIGGWVGHKVDLNTMVKRKNFIIALARNLTSVVQPEA